MDFLLNENILAALVLLIGLSVAYVLYSRGNEPYIVTSLTSKSSASALPGATSASSVKKVPTASGSSSSSSSSSSAKSSAAAVADAKAAARKASKRAAATSISGPRGANHLSLFFGSQTGTAEDFARQVAKEAKTLGFAPVVIDLEDYDAATDLANETLAIFFMATYGEGEPTDNAKKFYEHLLHADKTTTSLPQLRFAVFGLGNKTYEHYNTMGKQTDKILGELGGQRVVPLGLGDDDSSLEVCASGDRSSRGPHGCLQQDDFVNWKSTLLQPFASLAALPTAASAASASAGAPLNASSGALTSSSGASLTDSTDSNLRRSNASVFAPSYELRTHAPDSPVALDALAKQRQPCYGIGTPADNNNNNNSTTEARIDARSPLVCRVVVNRELHSDKSDRSCRHVEIDMSGRLRYEPGDHIGIFAPTERSLVERVAARLGLPDLSAVVSLDEPATARVVMPACTLRRALTYYIELNGVLRQSVLAALALYASGADKERLLTWASTSEVYLREVKEACVTLPELLSTMPTLAPPIAVLLEIMPKLAPRYYSISSSPLAHANRIHVTAVVVRNITSTGRVHDGLCTSWLARIASSPDEPIACFVRASHFRLPRSLAAPLLMIGPGTGIAPFRGFIHERRLLIEKARASSSTTNSSSSSSSTVSIGDAVLYYGCRRRDTDALYLDELTAARSDGTLTQLHIAESRLTDEERSSSEALRYVQHMLARTSDRETILRLLAHPESRLYICGDARVMARDVHEALRLALASAASSGSTDAERLLAADVVLANMVKQQRFLKDVWQ